MLKTIVTQLADFAHDVTYENLPEDVISDSKRLLLDSIGCALAGVDHPISKIGIDYAKLFPGKDATVMGTNDKYSLFGASFANGELINALDFDVVLPPGHVSPYVLPAPMAVAEKLKSSGKEVIISTAISHEMSFRFGKALDYIRDIKNGKVSPPAVFGYSSTIFGATAAVGRLKGYNNQLMANAIGLAAYVAPVSTQKIFSEHAPSTTIKYTLAGWIPMSALTASMMAELGHRADMYVFEDEYGYYRMVGSTRWEPTALTSELGTKWLFPPSQSYKMYPFCRILATPLDTMVHMVNEHDIKPEEIESVKAWVEAFAIAPGWMCRTIEHQMDAQFCFAHALSIAAHRIPPGKHWQDYETVFNPSILKLMDKISFEAHPDYVKEITKNPLARPTRIEIKARGETFVEDRMYPKGSLTPQPETYLTNDELVEKFLANAEGVISTRKANELVNAVLNLEDVDDFSKIMKLTTPTKTRAAK
jgi:2-methylcitrate dehydratase PrpD